jgi:organic hydroperoxide reductase OsmC/OhrA
VAKTEHTYNARLIWEGNSGEGTRSYTAYGRQYRILVAGKADLMGSADPAFRGDAKLHNPEDLLLTSISACHMLFYLSLCARQSVRVLSYQDDVQGRMTVHPDGGGKFDEVTLHPAVTIEGEENAALAAQLHETAHELCIDHTSVLAGIWVHRRRCPGFDDR